VRFRTFLIGILNLFRISDFEFRISRVTSSPRHRQGRRGVVSMYLLVAAPLFLAVLVVSLRAASLYHRRLEMQIAVDAAALAGANALVDDALLTETAAAQDAVRDNARTVAQRYAHFNPVAGGPLTLNRNAQNCLSGELVLGKVDNRFDRHFDARPEVRLQLYEPGLNAVRVEVHRLAVAVQATAFVDRDIVGFRIRGTSSVRGQTVPAIPVMPLALLTDPCPPGQNNPLCWAARNRASWEYQVLARHGGDGWRRNAQTGVPEEGSDGIPEMTVVFSEEGIHQADNTQVVNIGTASAAEAIRQLQTGITYLDLQDRQGRLLLDANNQLVLPRQRLSAADVSGLYDGLLALVGKRRVWPVYSAVLPADNTRPESVLVLGFVVARVMSVFSETVGPPGQTRLRTGAVLQPAMLITATAVADPAQRDKGLRTIFNPYVCKVRLVE
jgi:hypothetical protein